MHSNSLFHFTFSLFLNLKPSEADPVGGGGQQGGYCGSTTDLAWSVIARNDLNFLTWCLCFFFSVKLFCSSLFPEKQCLCNCSQLSYLDIINLSCNKRLPGTRQACGSWHNSAPRTVPVHRQHLFLIGVRQRGLPGTQGCGSKGNRPDKPGGGGWSLDSRCDPEIGSL